MFVSDYFMQIYAFHVIETDHVLECVINRSQVHF